MKIFLLSLLSLLVLSASAQIPKPQKNTYINDLAHVLSEGDVVKLNKRLYALEKQKQVQMAIVLINNVPASYTIKQYARQIGKTWKVGKNQRGIVYVAAIRQLKQQLEVSRKLDSVFTADKSQEILSAVKPSFKSGTYSKGLAALINEVDAALVAPVLANAQPQQQAATSPAAAPQANAADDDGNFWVGLLTICVIIGIVVWLVRRANQRRRMQQQQYFNQNNPGYYNPNTPGPGNTGYNNGGYGNYPPPYNTPPQNNTLRDMATGAIIGGALGYGARALQDRHSDGDSYQDPNNIRPENTPYRTSDDIPNEPSNWGDWGSGGNNSDAGDYSDPSKFTDNSWDDNSSSDGGWGDSGSSDSGSFDSDSSDSGGGSDW